MSRLHRSRQIWTRRLAIDIAKFRGGITEYLPQRCGDIAAGDLSCACQYARHLVGTHAMLDWSKCPAVERVPNKVGGAWLFKGTRVPVRALFENLENGARVDDFLEWFPGVAREQVELVLRHAEHSLEVA